MTPPDAGAPVMQLSDAVKVFPGPAPVAALRGVSLQIRRGEFLAITGPSGSGKSTLLNVLGLLDTITGGQHHVLGRDVRDLPQRELTRLRSVTIGFVFQQFHLVAHETVRANVELPLIYQGVRRPERRDRAESALTTVGMQHRLAAYPTTLSGGESQRVAVARALVTQPQVLLCDEPTGNLDSANTDTIIGLLHAVARDTDTPRAVIVVTHDPAVAAAADRQLDLRDGRIEPAPVQP